MANFLIYVLSGPDGEIRYVGQTTKTLNRRLREHLQPSCLKKPSHRTHWLKGLVDIGERPTIALLQVLYGEGDANAAEIYWIAWCRQNGYRLVNDAEGGCGVRGLSAETRQKMSDAKKGMVPKCSSLPKSESTKELIRQAHIGKKASEETKIKMGNSRRGRKHTDETKRLMSAKALGRPKSDEAKRNISEAARRRKPPSEEARKNMSLAGQKRWAKLRLTAEPPTQGNL